MLASTRREVVPVPGLLRSAAGPVESPQATSVAMSAVVMVLPRCLMSLSSSERCGTSNP